MAKRCGRDDRFARLVDDNAARLVAFGVRRNGDVSESEDLAAEAFEVLWRKYWPLPDEEALPLLYRIVDNLAQNNRRRRFRRRRAMNDLSLERPSQRSFEDEVVTGMQIRNALNGLSVDDQLILTLTAWEGASTEALALTLGISPGAARTRLHRARTRLADAIQANDQLRERQTDAR